ncbi:hypothetical protein Aeqsu_0152 [Aequorivita sublithincola DSM 14238]|uniref:Tellurite resistance protein TerB n=1 Tax=Aequorivita sublithincola (strain DSM 14238 / LMG 21431 / ACAM 643 / 9-3) TaxID=746697 RepID=I3YRR2_AEQSU|nr:hypothetical protein [Aequorivita sublithincola]AFL79680.1 hypothetical protein Aeqsu_0152 [Aequorivita sublithincola DSM 14238]
MGTLEKPQLLFYQKTGELFYAIAAADKVVRKEEYNALKKLVLEEWKDLDAYEDPFHTDAAHQIEVVFEWFDYEQLEAKECFDSFADYKTENAKLFTKERKELIWKTANAIANSFAGKNKIEVIMLAKLKILLKD